jgi:hypothetical protein
MASRLLATTVLCALAATASAQSVTTVRAASGLAVAVVEMPEGDVEHITAALPPGVAVAGTIAGFPVTVHPRRGGGIITLAVPATLSGPVLDDTLKQLASTGCAGLVLLGPTPVRDLAAAGESLAAVPFRPDAPPQCILAEGGVALRRGPTDEVTLDFALPGPDDPRFDLLPVLASWLQDRLATSFPNVQVTIDGVQGCSLLRVAGRPEREEPRAYLARLRETLARLAVATPTADQLSALATEVRRRQVVMARDGEQSAIRLVQRLARGGDIAAAVAVPAIESGTVTSLAGAFIAGHPGSAIITEAERRPVPATPQTLENGVIVSTTWVSGDIAILAVALGGVDPEVAAPLLAKAAGDASQHGWAADLGEQAGVATLAVAVPADDVVAALELLSDELGSAQPSPASGLDADVGHALGLAPHPASESVSLALALPEESDEGPEAATKFFSMLSSGGVRVAPAAPTAGLNWSAGQGIPEIAALVDIPPSTEGLIAGAVLASRLGAQPAVSTRWLAPAGRLVLEVRGQGEVSVPALDARLGTLWKEARRTLRPGEEAAATRSVEGMLFGDATRATARAAAAVFLPVTPSIESLLGADPKEVGRVLASLPAWDAIVRLGAGAGPPAPTPVPTRAVRKSRPSRP